MRGDGPFIELLEVQSNELMKPKDVPLSVIELIDYLFIAKILLILAQLACVLCILVDITILSNRFEFTKSLSRYHHLV